MKVIQTRQKAVLIESDWNLKEIPAAVICSKIIRINRIRLEFKVCHYSISIRSLCVLIESDWNLKQKEKTLERRVKDVLIESDWNLKTTSKP